LKISKNEKKIVADLGLNEDDRKDDGDVLVQADQMSPRDDLVEELLGLMQEEQVQEFRDLDGKMQVELIRYRENLREALGVLLENCGTEYNKVIRVLKYMLEKLKVGDRQFRKLNIQNEKFKQRLSKHKGCLKVLRLFGFEPLTSKRWIWTEDKMEFVAIAEEILEQIERREYEIYRFRNQDLGFRIRGDGDFVRAVVTYAEQWSKVKVGSHVLRVNDIDVSSLEHVMVTDLMNRTNPPLTIVLTQPSDEISPEILAFLEQNDAKLDIQLKEIKSEIEAVNNRLLRVEDLQLELPQAFSSEIQIREVFQEFDTDGNGVLDPKEFRRAIRKLGFDRPKDVLDNLFHSIDLDGNGTLDYNEFNLFLKQSVPEIVTTEYEVKCVIHEYPPGFDLALLGEPIVEAVYDQRFIDSGVKRGCVMTKVAGQDVSARGGKYVMQLIRRYKPPFEVVFRIADGDDDVMNFHKFTLGLYDDKEGIGYQILNVFGGIIGSIIFSTYAFLPLLDIGSDVTVLMYIVSNASLDMTVLVSILLIAFAIRGTIMLHIVTGDADGSVGSNSSYIVLFIPGIFLLMDLLGFNFLHTSSHALETMPGSSFECFWYFALCAGKREFLPAWIIELFAFWFIPFYPLVYLQFGVSFIESIWISSRKPDDYPLKLSFIFALTLSLPQFIIQTLWFVESKLDFTLYTVSNGLAILHFVNAYVRFNSRMEALEGFTEIRKHSAEVKIVRYLYTDFNLAISYICSVDTNRRLMFWSMASGDQNMIGAWACLGFRDLSNDVEDMTYFEDKNCICIIYHHPNPGLELRTVPDGLILHQINLHCKPVAVSMCSMAVLLGRGFWVCGSDDHSLRIFDHGIECFRVIDLPTDNDSKFAFSLDGKNLAVAVGAAIYVYTVENVNASPLKLEGHRGDIVNVLWLSTENLITVDSGSEIRCWSIETGNCLTRLPLARYEINFTELCDTEPLLAVAHSGCGRLDIWELKIEPGKKQQWKRKYKFGLDHGISSLEFCPYGILVGDQFGSWHFFSRVLSIWNFGW